MQLFPVPEPTLDDREQATIRAMAEAPPVDQSLMSESRNDLIQSIFRGYLNHDTGHRQLRLIAIGESGQGKSALVNPLTPNDAFRRHN